MKFSDVIGNSRAVDRIRHMVDGGQMPHALLIHGAPGVPKLALARAAAQYLHCTSRTPQGEPCGQCPSCLQHQSFNHADTYFSFPVVRGAKSSEPNSDDYIDEWKEFLCDDPAVEDYQKWVRMLAKDKDNAQPIIYQNESEKIIRQMSMTAYTARYKVLVMWLPEKMTEVCANKLLKLIEEPGDDCVFLLVSDNASAVLPTIYSRTQRVELKRPSTEQIAAYLQQRYQITMQDAMAVAAPADGNVVQAEHNLEADSETKRFFELFVQLMRLAYQRDLAQLKVWSEEVAALKRERTRRFLAYCTRMVRENFIMGLHTTGLNYLTADEERFSARFSPYINVANVEQLIYQLDRAERDVRMNGNAKIVLFDLALQVTILIKR